MSITVAPPFPIKFSLVRPPLPPSDTPPPFHNPNTAPIFPPSLISQTDVGKQENPKSQLNTQRNTWPNTCSLTDFGVVMFLYFMSYLVGFPN